MQLMPFIKSTKLLYPKIINLISSCPKIRMTLLCLGIFLLQSDNRFSKKERVPAASENMQRLQSEHFNMRQDFCSAILILSFLLFCLLEVKVSFFFFVSDTRAFIWTKKSYYFELDSIVHPNSLPLIWEDLVYVFFKSFWMVIELWCR